MKVHCRAFKGLFIALVAAMLSIANLHAQSISGTVVDADNKEPLIGANIAVKDANRGSVSDTEGNFSIEVRAGEKLIISYIGYATQELVVGTEKELMIQLKQENLLQEITVTALGISREKKSLGYSVQEVSGSNMDKARETNIVNALSGKVAGLTIVGNPSGIGSSARVTIRGERSLNINSNQPLFVVDGVPISNEFRGSSGNSYQDVDYGNGAGLVNPDDVASITVLKGASAAALYGSRANNGVILITTKSGKNTKGIGVSINSTVSFENVLRLPEYQNIYGQGLNGVFEFKDGNGGGAADGVDESWGPAMEGQLIRQFESPTSNGFRGGDVGNLFTSIGPVNLDAQLAARGEITATPFIARPDNVRDFFETGVTQTHNVAISGSNDKSDFRLSYTWLDQTGVVPNTDLQRNS
ncbi:MAG: TonB-dependent receptor plug domain-containing protein, partial [Saprospiraceae bacterium]|nr:TonB-dependent receptor plug domain-containing protein [Saprospiraceae bacterium]